MIYEPTAWYSYAQFSDIFNRLSNLDDHENILFQIELWKAHGKVPAAIHATYLLLNVINCDRKSQIYESNIRDLYSMSIIRTVNLLLDQEQDSLYAKSMILMGKEANLPESIIKCRHRCSHGDIPDVESLRLVSREAINYIYKKYWINQYHLINSRLNDDYQYSFLLFTTFLLCRSGMDNEFGINSRDYYSPRKKNIKNKKSSKEYFQIDTNSLDLKYTMEYNSRLMNFIVNKRNLSINRHLNQYLKKNISDITRQTVELFNFTTKKLLNSCVDEDIFISVFVEYVFCNYKPEQSQLFFLFFFYILSQYSFNFTLKLVAHMFNYILETNDMFTDLKTLYKDSISHRVKLYKELMTNFNKDDLNKVCQYTNDKDNTSNGICDDAKISIRNGTNNNSMNNSLSNTSKSNHINNYLNGNLYDKEQLNGIKYNKYQDNVNNWLLELVRYGTSLKTNQFSKYHLKYLKIIKVLPFDDCNRMMNYEYTALTRALVAVDLLSSLLLLRLPNQTIKNDPDNWRSDKLSHLINISECLRNSGKYKFKILDEDEKNKIIMESRNKSKDFIQELNKNLLPGTMWDNQLCRVVQTYPLDDTCKVNNHRRILSAFERIRKDDFIKYIEGNKKRDKIQTQMCNMNGFIGTGNTVQIRLQKKLFKVVSLVTNHFKSSNSC